MHNYGILGYVYIDIKLTATYYTLIIIHISRENEREIVSY